MSEGEWVTKSGPDERALILNSALAMVLTGIQANRGAVLPLAEECRQCVRLVVAMLDEIETPTPELLPEMKEVEEDEDDGA
jgi:hypothetical protein